MLVVVGTIPDPDVPVLDALVEVAGSALTVGGRALPPDRGTPALLAAAAMTCDFLGENPPHALLVGDEGLGNGSRALYRHLTEALPERRCAVLAFHYLQPDVDWHNRVLMAAQAMAGAPAPVADAGFMYAAKMSGFAGEYALFTPDAGELAFLADEAAPHPFYTRGFILQDEDRVPELIRRAYEHDNAARCLLVKGRTDRIADRTGVLAEVSTPSVEPMEAMGGTGDTVTGMACALMASGVDAPVAAHVAAQANRYAGEAARPTPASQIGDPVPHIPQPGQGHGGNPVTKRITPDMTLLDVVHKYRATEAVFHTRDEQAGECLLCQALFETVADVAARYGLDLDKLLADLNAAASEAAR